MNQPANLLIIKLLPGNSVNKIKKQKGLVEYEPQKAGKPQHPQTL